MISSVDRSIVSIWVLQCLMCWRGLEPVASAVCSLRYKIRESKAPSHRHRRISKRDANQPADWGRLCNSSLAKVSNGGVARGLVDSISSCSSHQTGIGLVLDPSRQTKLSGRGRRARLLGLQQPWDGSQASNSFVRGLCSCRFRRRAIAAGMGLIKDSLELLSHKGYRHRRFTERRDGMQTGATVVLHCSISTQPGSGGRQPRLYQPTTTTEYVVRRTVIPVIADHSTPYE